MLVIRYILHEELGSEQKLKNLKSWSSENTAKNKNVEKWLTKHVNEHPVQEKRTNV
jgi:hypothetical protein